MRFQEGQSVTVSFNGLSLAGRIVENIDHTCAPLKDMWLVHIQDGEWNARFGLSGEALVPANHP